MSHTKRNSNRIFDRNKQNQIEIVRFLGRNFVVQSKRKISGVMYYDLIAAESEDIAGQRFVAVPHTTLTAHKETSDEVYFGSIKA